MANIIGIPTEKLILSSSSFRRERVGLERINHVYTGNKSDSNYFYGKIKNGASHETITNFLIVPPATEFQYENMLVENVDISDEPGELVKYNTTYVGLISNARPFPEPLISFQPVAEYVFYPWSISVEFIEYIGGFNSLTESRFKEKYKFFLPAPLDINEKPMPQSPVAPVSGSIAEKPDAPFFSAIPPEAENGIYNYKGLTITAVSFTRYGNYAHTLLTLAESAFYAWADTDLNVFRKFLNWPPYPDKSEGSRFTRLQ